ncbi:MAG: ABC transporter permease, partial [Bacteroidota bacterium]
TEHDHGEEHQHEIDLLPDETQLLAKQAPHVEEIDHKYDTDEAIDGEKEITAVLLKYKSKMAVLNMPRIINEQTNMQAVLPGLEVNRLFNMIGIGATTLRLIAAGIMLMAGFSVFFVLYNRLRERKYELALMRSVGYRPGHLFALLVLEGLLLAVLAYVLGWLVSRLGIYVINQQAERDFNLHFGADWVPGEELLLIMTIVVGLVSALLPAWRAMRMDVAAILSESRT